MKTLSRKKVRITIITMVIGFGLAGLALLLQKLGFPYAIAVWCFALLSLVVSAFLMSRCNRCPYCGERLRGLHWSKAEADTCPQCKQTVYYDDSREDDR